MEDKKRNYDSMKDARRYIAVNLNCQLLGVWGNLKKLCEEMKEKDGAFLSYSSLSKRRDKENPMEFETAQGKYSVYIEKLK
jgi:hypothetical protein